MRSVAGLRRVLRGAPGRYNNGRFGSPLVVLLPARLMRVRYAVLGAVVAVALTFVGVLLDSGPRLAASNSRVIASAGRVVLQGGERRCQGGEFVPAEAARLRVYPGTDPAGGPPLEVSVRDRSGRVVSRIRQPGGYPPDVALDIALPPGRPTVELGELCVRNAGRRPVGFAGNLGSLNPATPGASNGPGQRGSDEIRVDYWLPGEPSWLAVATRVVDRAAFFRPGFMGPWTIWLALIALVAVCALTLRFVLRQLEERP